MSFLSNTDSDIGSAVWTASEGIQTPTDIVNDNIITQCYEDEGSLSLSVRTTFTVGDQEIDEVKDDLKTIPSDSAKKSINSLSSTSSSFDDSKYHHALSKDYNDDDYYFDGKFSSLLDEKINLSQFQVHNVINKLQISLQMNESKIYNKFAFEGIENVSNDVISEHIFNGAHMFLIDLSRNTTANNYEIIKKSLTRLSQTFFTKLTNFGHVKVQFIPILNQREIVIGNIDNNFKFKKFKLKLWDKITLTSDREWLNKGNKNCLYVNFRDIIKCLVEGDKISIQNKKRIFKENTIVNDCNDHSDNRVTLRIIRSIDTVSIECQCIHSGYIEPKMFVEFPSYVSSLLPDVDHQIPYEIEEDLNLCQRIGTNVIGVLTPEKSNYYDHLNHTIRTMRNSKFRVFTVIHMDNLVDDDREFCDWLSNLYDGIIFYVSKQHDESTKIDASADTDANIADAANKEIPKLTDTAKYLIKMFFKKKKPIILGGFSPVNLCSQASNERYSSFSAVKSVDDFRDLIYLYFMPDRYLQTLRHPGDLETNFQLIAFREFLENCENFLTMFVQYHCFPYYPFNDHSTTGSDTFARSIVRCAYDINASVILLGSTSGRMAIKISHYRPKCPIIILTSNQNLGQYEKCFHNIRIALFHDAIIANNNNNCGGGTGTMSNGTNYEHASFKLMRQFTFGVYYGIMENLVQDGDNVLYSFRRERNYGFPNKVVAYRVKRERILNLMKK